jgi:hypothetical protein
MPANRSAGKPTETRWTNLAGLIEVAASRTFSNKSVRDHRQRARLSKDRQEIEFTSYVGTCAVEKYSVPVQAILSAWVSCPGNPRYAYRQVLVQHAPKPAEDSSWPLWECIIDAQLGLVYAALPELTYRQIGDELGAKKGILVSDRQMSDCGKLFFRVRWSHTHQSQNIMASNLFVEAPSQ